MKAVFFFTLILLFVIGSRGSVAAASSDCANCAAESVPKEGLSRECDAMTGYPRPAHVPLACDGGPETSLCKNYWKKSDVTRQMKNVCDTKEDPFSRKFTPESREQKESKGLVSVAVSSNDRRENERKKAKRQELFSMAKQLIGPVSQACCAGNQECRAAMNRVDVKFCEPPSDPSAPDRCLGAAYSLSYSQSEQIWKSAYAKYFSPDFEKRVNPKDYQELKRIQGALKKSVDFFDKVKTFLKAKFSLPLEPMVPVSGKIVLGSYFRTKKAGTMNDSDAIRTLIVHELFHACDMIEAQRKVAQGEKDLYSARLAVERLKGSYLDTNLFCDLTDEKKEYYRKFWREMGESPALGDCLVRLAERALDPKSLDFCRNACRGSFLIESFAEVGQLRVFNQSFIPDAYPFYSCMGKQTAKHPLFVNVLECMAQYSERFRNNFKKAYSCE